MTNVHALVPRPFFSVEYRRRPKEEQYRPMLKGGLLNEATPVELPMYLEGTLCVRDQPVHAGSLPRHISRNLVIVNAEIDLNALPIFIGGNVLLHGCTAKNGLLLPRHVSESVYLVECDFQQEVVPGSYIGTYFVVAESIIKALAPGPEYIGGTIRTTLSAAEAVDAVNKAWQADQP